MSMHALQEIERNLDKVGEDLWGCSDLDEVFDGVLQKLSQLKAQLYVQRSLQKTAKLLQEQANDKPLPNQQATRVKRFIRFTFGMSTRGNERHTKLRKLECNALKFCGLAYTIKELLELPQAHFDFLVASVVDFVHHYKLSQYLYRDDIDKAVIGKFEAEDEDSMKEFLKCLSASPDQTSGVAQADRISTCRATTYEKKVRRKYGTKSYLNLVWLTTGSVKCSTSRIRRTVSTTQRYVKSTYWVTDKTNCKI